MLAANLFVVILLLPVARSMSGVVKRSDDPEPLEIVVEKLSANVAQLQTTLAAVQSKLDAVSETVNRHVAFWVRLSPDDDNTVPAPPSGPYKFTQVVLNDGNGYDPISGIFTVPVSGVYNFALQIFLRGPQDTLIDIKVNGHIISRMSLDTITNSNGDDSDSTSVTVKVNAGDEVWVESGNGAHTYVSDVHTYFTGHLLYAV
nr:hypothetical protein BaRGS_030938 [Batillaria attramentaria]